jgi:hypothetical protein
MRRFLRCLSDWPVWASTPKEKVNYINRVDIPKYSKKLRNNIFQKTKVLEIDGNIKIIIDDISSCSQEDDEMDDDFADNETQGIEES